MSARDAEHGRETADRWAAQARAYWEAGDLTKAAAYNHACHQVDPARAGLWHDRAAALTAAAARLPLAEATQVRLIAAGFSRSSPELGHIRETNAAAGHRGASKGREAA